MRYVPQEGAQIARFLGISEDELIQKYTRLALDRKGLVFQEQLDGACIFLTPENRCAIHPVKPQKCRDYPYRWQTIPEQQHLCQGSWSGDAP